MNLDFDTTLGNSHQINNHVNAAAKSARWAVSCSCGWSRNRFNSGASANAAGLEHQAASTERFPVAS